MATRVFDLKQTASTFQLRGIVTGTKGKQFYANGDTKNGGKWNAIEFGVTVNTGKNVYVKINGFPRNEVYYYKRGENGANSSIIAAVQAAALTLPTPARATTTGVPERVPV